MFSVNGNPIIENEIVVLQELRRQLLINGQDLLRVFKPTGATDVMTCCPFHKNGMERKPSFGVSLLPEMKCHCFTCGWAGTLDQFISAVFGYEDEGSFGRQWLSKNFLTVSVESRKALNLCMERTTKSVAINTGPGFTEEELDSYRYSHPYMHTRGLTDEIIERFDVGYDDNFVFRDNLGEVKGVLRCLTFPVYNTDGSPAFVARRGVDTKFFHYPEECQKPVYLANEFVSGKYKTAMICESFLNALTGWKYGVPSLALIGTGSKYQYDILRKLPVRKYIIATDPDEAGDKAAWKLKKELGSSKVLTKYVMPSGQDINDLQGKILDLQEIYL